MHTVFALLCFVVVLHWLIFPVSIRLTSLALWQSNDCPSASKATLMNMDKYFMWIHYERLHNHNKAKHNKTVCIFLGIYCRRSSGGGISYIVTAPTPIQPETSIRGPFSKHPLLGIWLRVPGVTAPCPTPIPSTVFQHCYWFVIVMVASNHCHVTSHLNIPSTL